MLTVLTVGYPFAPLGPDAVGGAEQVASMLDEALTGSGHESLVVAAAGSVTRGVLYPTRLPPRSYEDDGRPLVHREHAMNVHRALADHRVDLVHLHGVDFFEYLPPPGPPVLVTLHLPPSCYPARSLPPARPNTYIHCVSDSQMRGIAPSLREHASTLSPIRNGVRLERFALAPAKNERLVAALGRICPEKGFHLALEAAALADADLVLGGVVFDYPAHREYFEREIAPRLDSRRIFVGPLGARQKADLLGRAQCLVVPSLIEETSSLVAMEALASGTPVVAFATGALSEIVEDGKTGFLVNDVASMARAIRACDRIDPAACRASAETRFSAVETSARYLARYHALKRGLRDD